MNLRGDGLAASGDARFVASLPGYLSRAELMMDSMVTTYKPQTRHRWSTQSLTNVWARGGEGHSRAPGPRPHGVGGSARGAGGLGRAQAVAPSGLPSTS